MATTQKKTGLYEKIDETLAGGLLPGGAKPTGSKDPQAEADREAQQACVAKGGKWDPTTRKCIMPQPTQEAPKTDQPKNADQVFRDQESGNISGVTIGGKTYLGLNPQDVEKMTAAQQAKQQGGQATQAFEQGAMAQQQQAQQQAISQEALSNLGLSPQQIAAVQSGLVEAPIDWGQAGMAGAARALPSAVTGLGTGLAAGMLGAKAGAIAGTAITPGLGTVIGGAVGLLGGLTSGILANIKQQQKGEINAADQVLTRARTNMRQLSTLAAKDPGNAAIYVEAYNQQLAQVYQAQAKIKLETSGNLNKFMEDGADILSDFELFLQPNGQAQIYRRQLELALMSGVAPSLTVDDFAE